MSTFSSATSLRVLITLAGTPATTSPLATSFVTTLPAATTALSPICTPSNTTALAPIRTL